MKLAIGTKVRMSRKGKICFGDNRTNPHNVVGEVLEIERKESLGYRYALDCLVVWENGYRNTYNYIHLEPLVDLSSKSLEDYL